MPPPAAVPPALPELSVLCLRGAPSDDVRARIDRTLAAAGVSYEILVAPDEHAQLSGEGVMATPAPTRLQVLTDGLARARGRFLVTMAGDGTHPPEVLAQLWAARDTAEIVIASRYVAGGAARMPRLRQLLSPLLNRFVGSLLALPYRDLSSDYRLHARHVLVEHDFAAAGDALLIEVLLRVHAFGWRVREIPFHFETRGADDRGQRVSVRLARAYLGHLLSLFRLRNSLFSADYDERAFDSRIPLQRWWQRTRYRLVRGMAADLGAPVLDIGCGSSRIVQSLPGAIGLDVDLKKLRYLRQRGVLVVRGELGALPFADGAFPGVICSEVLEHLPENPAYFAELNRVLVPGGVLVVGVPDYGGRVWPALEWVYGKILPGAYAEQHITHYDRPRLLRRLAEHGFAADEVAYIARAELIIRAHKVRASPAPVSAPSPAAV